jgi:pyruvate dehydrogenase E1 component alpha subunit
MNEDRSGRGKLVFEEFDPRKGSTFRLLNTDGTLDGQADRYEILSDEQARKAYEVMVLARQADEWGVSLNRQGRMGTYVPNRGQEANSVGSLMALRQSDWFVPAFREMGGLLVRGVPLSQYYLYWYGNEAGSRMPTDEFRTLPTSVPVGSQALHAVGLAWADSYLKRDGVAITFLGDGATSQGEVAEAFNFAGIWNLPVIFFIQNNQWAISFPSSGQTASKTLAEKAFAYGFEGVRIDGNDVFAVYAATSIAASKARSGGGPTLIEGVTYRMGAHTTSDDPSRYRDAREAEEWEKRDPIVRLERYLMRRKCIGRKEIEAIRKDAAEAVRCAFEEAEAHEKPGLEDVYKHIFETMPGTLQRQLQRRKSESER